MDNNPVTIKSVAETYHLEPSTLAKNYKDNLSDFRTWEQKDHASDWMLMEQNVGQYMSIDETAPSRGELFTILSNKAGHGRKGTIAATVRGTRSEDLSSVFNLIPLEKRLEVKEVTMDFSDSMYAAVANSFPKADITIDCFHVIQLATNALNEIRLTYKRKAMAEDAKNRREHKQRLKQNAEEREKRQQKREQLGIEKSPRGRKPKRKNEAYVPPRFENGDTAVELLTRSRYLLMQGWDKWKGSQRQRADVLFAHYPKLYEAYCLVNSLRNIFKTRSLTPSTATIRLQIWHSMVRASHFAQLKTVADTIESRLEHVVNYFKERHTNSSAESLNSKIKGFRSMMRGVSDISFFFYRLCCIYC